MNKLEKLLSRNWRGIGCCAAIVERMYPNYCLFSELSEFGDATVFRNGLDLVWSCVADHRQSIDFSKQLDKLEPLTPDIVDFDFFGVRPAIDACVALSLLFDVCALNEPLDFTNFVAINHSTISAYLEAIEYRDEFDEHPLLLDANRFVKELSTRLSDDRLAPKEWVSELRMLINNYDGSNIGIET